MKSYKTLFFLFIICSFTNLQAQENKKIDSLLKLYETQKEDTLKVRILGDLYYATQYNDNVQSKKYAVKRLSLAQKLRYETGIADANYTMAAYYFSIEQLDSTSVHLENAMELYTKLKNDKGIFITTNMKASLLAMKGDYNEALKLYDKCIKNRIKVKDSVKLAGTYVHRGHLHDYMGNHRKAYDDVLAALTIYNKINQPLWKADALGQLSVLEEIFKNYNKALEYSLKSFKIYEEYGDKTYMGAASNAIGNYYLKLKDYENAKKFLKKSIVLCEEQKLHSYVGTAKKNLGLVFIEQNQYEKGISQLQDALRIHRNGSPELSLLATLDAIGHTYNKINKPRKALKHFNEAVSIEENKHLSGRPASIYEGRSKAFELIKDYENSLNDFKMFKSLNDSVFNTDKTKQIEELRTIYETEKKEQQIALQENEITVLEQKAEISSLQRLLLGFGLGLSLLVFGIGYYALRQKIKRNKLEKEKLDTELTFKKKELTTHALHLAKKNEALVSLKQKAEVLKTSENNTNGYQQLIRTINFDLQDDNNWENFSKYFQEVHQDFNTKAQLKFPQITPNDLRYMALIKMNLSSKEIANILNISSDGIKKARQRLRKKMEIDTKQSLEATIIAI